MTTQPQIDLLGGDPSEVVRRLVALANRLLGAGPDGEGRRVVGRPTLDRSRLDRVARLRDEFHATANRVARFAVDDCPNVEPVRITAPSVASTILPPTQLLSQLHLTASRLIRMLTPLSSGDWTRTCLMGGRVVTLGDLVGQVLDGAARDMLELLETAPERVVTLSHRRSARDRSQVDVATTSSWRMEHRDAAAS
jgi:hypothetical protein